MVMDKLKEALEQKNDSSIEANIKVLKEVFNDIHNKDYDHEVDRKVAKCPVATIRRNDSCRTASCHLRCD